MIRSDYIFLFSLLLMAIFIWLRDTAWVSSADDTLPILVALPLFVWLGAPWHFSSHKRLYSLPLLMGGSLLMLAGIMLNVTLLLTLGWTSLLWTWLSRSLVSPTTEQLKKLLVMPLLAFPWISLDLNRIGWWFRLSGAWVTGHLFSAFGLDVSQEGTNLLINKLPISVEVACAGLNTLQSMLVAGVFIDYIILGGSRLFWINLPLLVLLAWIANTLRIFGISAAALYISPQFAMGKFHVLGGWFIIVAMFLLSWLLFSLQEPSSTTLKGSNDTR